MTLVLRSAASLTVALAVGLSVGPAQASAADASSGPQHSWCMRIAPGTDGPCPVTPPPGDM